MLGCNIRSDTLKILVHNFQVKYLYEGTLKHTCEMFRKLSF